METHCASMCYQNTSVWKSSERVWTDGNTLYVNVPSKYLCSERFGKSLNRWKQIVRQCAIKILLFRKVWKEFEQMETHCTSMCYLIRSKYLCSKRFGKSLNRWKHIVRQCAIKMPLFGKVQKEFEQSMCYLIRSKYLCSERFGKSLIRWKHIVRQYPIRYLLSTS